jgi:hypothetical protein
MNPVKVGGGAGGAGGAGGGGGVNTGGRVLGGEGGLLLGNDELDDRGSGVRPADGVHGGGGDWSGVGGSGTKQSNSWNRFYETFSAEIY